jgi:GNAT superfamily N-acetyltransferase
LKCAAAGRKVASLHEFVNGETDTETVVRIVNEVVPWGNQTVDTIEHARKHLKGFREDDPDGLAYAERRGYRCVSRARGLRLVLVGLPAPEVRMPDELTITTLAERRDLAHSVWKLACETMPEIPIDTDEPFHPGTFEQFTELSLNSPHSIPEATFVALQGDKPVGYARLVWHDEEAGIGYHQMLGVTHAFRGRGIASVLKGKQIAWAIDHGLTELRTQNEVRNAPVRALNGHYPYEPMPDMLVMRGPLASPPRGQR